MKIVKFILPAFFMILAMSSPVKAELKVPVVPMPWGFDVMIENDTNYEGFKEIEIAGRRDFFYIGSSDKDHVFRSVIVTGLKHRPIIKLIRRDKDNL